MKQIFPTRREFLVKSYMAGLGAALGVGIPALKYPEYDTVMKNGTSDTRIMAIKPRYHRWFVDPGSEWLETNTGYAKLDWKIPVSQAALVLVDVWQRHYLKDTEARAEDIIRSNLVPLLAAIREAGINIIHAPSPEVAALHPNWVKLQTEEERHPQHDSWPPPEFRNKTGPYKSFAMPFEPREKERDNLPAHTFHPLVTPLGKEPVIATGEELHRYCKTHGILFLFLPDSILMPVSLSGIMAHCRWEAEVMPSFLCATVLPGWNQRKRSQP